MLCLCVMAERDCKQETQQGSVQEGKRDQAGVSLQVEVVGGRVLIEHVRNTV